ncbi:MAG: MBL fold metallo-hydrolase [Brucellaceae bacterium]|nr:MBL fold metallo-hydrolase [Brucellaceae bacterium]
MGDRLRFTVLGCGSSPGVPRPMGDWGACEPSNPKNRRRRPALLVQRVRADGALTNVVIDTGPDFREQMLSAGVGRLDAVVYTHAHADHIHGIDDLRSYFLAQRQRIPIWADAPTQERLFSGFGYCFATQPGSSYPPILEANDIEAGRDFTIAGEGGDIVFRPLLQAHGSQTSLAFRINNVAYCTDVSDFSDETSAQLRDLDWLILDALQYRPHPSHLSLDQALEWIGRLKPRRAVLTHMHTPLDYDAVMAATPEHVEPGYDGLRFEIDAD